MSQTISTDRIKSELNQAHSSLTEEVNKIVSYTDKLIELNLNTKAHGIIARIETVAQMLAGIRQDIQEMKISYSEILGK
ncbi:MAG: hypothetical protein EB150_10240 [Nitrososphaeria archaeon]|jgi:hypothetical protein|nr:hypothetical protein [Nitrososphaeria archaeon]